MWRRCLPLLLLWAVVSTPQLAVAQTIEELYRQGNAAQAESRFKEAERVFRLVIEREPNDAVAYYKLGNALYKQGKLDEAIANYNKAIKINPNDAIAYYNLGNALSDRGKLDEAIANYNKAIKINPNDADAYYNLGNALSDRGKLDEAIANYNKAIKINPNDADAYNNLGNALSDRGKLDEAIANYNKAIKINPNDADAYNNLGIVLSDQGKLDEAIANYNKAIQINPNDAAAYVSLGIALKDQGKLDEAFSLCQEGLKKPEKKSTFPASVHTLAHNCLGLVLKEQGKLEAAITEFKRSIAIDPNYAGSQNNLSETRRLLALRSSPPPVSSIDDRDHLPSIEDEPKVKVLRSTARIITQVSEGASIGTGWVCKRQGDTIWVVTNRHVVSDRNSQRPIKTIEVEFFSELPEEKRPRYQAKIEHTTAANNQSLDLAVLKITGVPDDIQPLKLNTSRIRLNTRVFVIGHPYTVDNPWNSASGEISNYNPNSSVVAVDANVAAGNSGGPVINENHEVIAVMVRIRSNLDLATRSDRATPVVQGVGLSTAGVGVAYHMGAVIDQLRQWNLLP